MNTVTTYGSAACPLGVRHAMEPWTRLGRRRRWQSGRGRARASDRGCRWRRDSGECRRMRSRSTWTARRPVQPRRRRINYGMSPDARGPREATDAAATWPAASVAARRRGARRLDSGGLAGVRAGEDVSVFGSGSLLWNPLLDHGRAPPGDAAQLPGRRLCWSRSAPHPVSPGSSSASISRRCRQARLSLQPRSRGELRPAVAPRGSTATTSALGAGSDRAITAARLEESAPSRSSVNRAAPNC